MILKRQSYDIRTICIAIVFVVMSSCGPGRDTMISSALEEAGVNVSEIETVLAHYSDERQKVAEYLVSSMVGRYSSIGVGIDSIEMIYSQLPHKNGTWQFDSIQSVLVKRYEQLPVKKILDLQTLSSEYLIRNIDDAWDNIKQLSWNNNLTIDEFCELLLPYRSGNEEITDWRPVYKIALDSLRYKIDNAENSVEAARIVAKALGEIHYNNKAKTPHRPAIRLLHSPVGYCREECDRNIFAMRAFGIPVAVDEFLVSPDNGAQHQWNVVYDNIDGRYRMFNNSKYLPMRDSLHNDGRRRGKVYRQTLCLNFDRLDKFKDAVNPPSELLNPYKKDVTAEYFGHNEAKVEISSEINDVYLGLFTPDGFRPIDIARREGKYAIFEDIEPQLIYFPIKREGNGYQTCGMPFMLSRNNMLHSFVPSDKYSNVRLIRKMPFWLHHITRMKSVLGCRIQIGQTSCGPWIDLDSVKRIPTHSFIRIPVNMETSDRFIRIAIPVDKQAEIAEIIAATDSLAINRLPLTIISDTVTDRMRKLTDGDILSWTNYKSEDSDLIFNVESMETVNNIFFVPRNDDNYVMPGEEYELFYFDSCGWRSLGKKVAKNFHVDFYAPGNAVLWLRNLTKGREEQVFIWRNGKQIFNTNMSANTTF